MTAEPNPSKVLIINGRRAPGRCKLVGEAIMLGQETLRFGDDDGDGDGEDDGDDDDDDDGDDDGDNAGEVG